MSATGYRGVYPNQREYGKPYYAQVRRDGTQYYLGCFGVVEDAVRAVMEFEARRPLRRGPDRRCHRVRDPVSGRLVRSQRAEDR